MMLKSRSYSNHLVLTSHTQAVEVSVKAYFPTPHGTPDRHFPKPSPSSRNSTLHGDASERSYTEFQRRAQAPSSKGEKVCFRADLSQRRHSQCVYPLLLKSGSRLRRFFKNGGGRRWSG
ncbi:uncharacterized protein LOC9630056 [Selaginella moellendorffii]|uniref:uncharacterized protein LOC9630056 n=1 Tax=Selaginella moellendorffii TaxID=88036 RepID=UPI000D1CA407|nr:uncharacterized protein LOC9630056 [Selaginella moellendorffii]|eukprot:XP_024536248.1 uncharacterized protein LOC9630056 [Selaginella moellendorffii]